VTKVNEDDPPGYIRVVCAGLLGDEEAELPLPVAPCFDWGWFYIPDIGETVEVEVVTTSVEDESFAQSSIDDLDITWRNKRYHTSDETEKGTEARPVHPDFTSENYGKRRGFATPVGHIFLFDDTEGKTKVYLTWVKEKDNTDDVTTLLFDSDGTAKLFIFGGKHFVHLKENEYELNLDEGKHTFVMKENELEVKLDSGASAKVVGKDGDTVTTLGDGAVTATISQTLEEFWTNSVLIEFLKHKHPTAMGPSGPPDTPLPNWEPAINSTKLKMPDG
jgi:hypothetical protein